MVKREAWERGSLLDSPEYYKSQAVRKRILEYSGVKKELLKEPLIEENLRRAAESASTEYLVGWGGKLKKERGRAFEAVYKYSLEWLLENGLDIFRSVWDKEATLGVLDIEYFSKKYPGEPYYDQNAVFWKLEPFYQCIKSIFFRYGIRPLTIGTGQGYHFVFRVKKESEGHKKLEEIAHVEETLLGKYSHIPFGSKRKRAVSKEEALGFDGMGRLIEFIVHRAISEAGKWNVELPITICDVVTGNERMEGINCDLSMYAAPLHMRDIRVAFSTHHKHKVDKWKVGEWIAEATPIQIAIPRYTPCNDNELYMHEFFGNRRHFRNAANYAAAISTEIPEADITKLIEDYKASALYKFHRDYDSIQQESPWDWSKTYDKFELKHLPPCVSKILESPAPALLEPTNIQTLVRVLTGKEWWHPKHIAGLIRSKYERDFGWLSERGGAFDFYKYDANAMATIFVRFYSGLIATGIDGRVDQNCISHQEKGLCVQQFCGYNLADYK